MEILNIIKLTSFRFFKYVKYQRNKENIMKYNHLKYDRLPDRLNKIEKSRIWIKRYNNIDIINNKFKITNGKNMQMKIK